MFQSVSASTVQVKCLTGCRLLPPCVASQPIPSNLLSDVLQLIETECPYLSTTMGGFNSMGQEAPITWECSCDICIIATRKTWHCNIYLFVQSARWFGVHGHCMLWASWSCSYVIKRFRNSDLVDWIRPWFSEDVFNMKKNRNTI